MNLFLLQLLYRASFKFTGNLLRPIYVSLLTRLIAATEQDYRFATTDYVVDAVSLPDVDSEFAYPATNRAMVAKVAILDRLNAGQDRGFGLLVTQPFELLVEEFGVKDGSIRLVSGLIRDGGNFLDTFRGVSYKRQKLSEAGFAGLGGIFGIAGERLMAGWRILFCGGERADCLKQDLQDFGGFSGLQANG